MFRRCIPLEARDVLYRGLYNLNFGVFHPHVPTQHCMVVHVMETLVWDDQSKSVEGVLQSITTVLLSSFPVCLSSSQTMRHFPPCQSLAMSSGMPGHEACWLFGQGESTMKGTHLVLPEMVLERSSSLPRLDAMVLRCYHLDCAVCWVFVAGYCLQLPIRGPCPLSSNPARRVSKWWDMS